MSRNRLAGFFFFSLGAIACIYSGMRLTGFAISQSFGGTFFFLGTVLVVGGIILGTYGSNSLEIRLYQKEEGRRKEDYMTDPENFFGGEISLRSFKKEMAEIKKDPELLEEVKSAYLIPLIQAYRSEGCESEIAGKYLAEMGFDIEEMDEPRYLLPRKEIEKIKRVFRTSRGSPNKEQREILNKYNLDFSHGGEHGKIFPKNGGQGIVVSLTPSDWRASLNHASRVVKLCDSQFRKKMKSH